MITALRGLLAIVAALLLAGCGGEDDDSVRLEMLPERVGVPAGLNPILAHNFVVGESVPTDHERFLRETGVAWGDWDRVEPRLATLTIDEPGLDWSFALEVTLKAYRDDPAQQVELFYRDEIPLNVGAQLQMIPTDFDVQELLGGGDFGLILEIRRLRQSPRQSFAAVLDYNWAGYQ